MTTFNLNKLMNSPTTHLQNLFSLMIADHAAIFGDCGFLITLDFESSAALPDLKALIRIVQQNQGLIYHIESYKVVLIFKEQDSETNESIFKKLKEINLSGFENILYKTHQYKEAISSISDFYRVIYKNYKQCIQNTACENLFHQVVFQFEHHLKEAFQEINISHELALTDDITGLQNARAAKQYIASVKNRRQSDQKKVVLFIDGDNLKSYNTISYEAGNEMIHDLAMIIKQSIRTEDQLFRWLSGDEFVVFLRDTKPFKAYIIAEKIRKSVEVLTAHWAFPITVSIGLSNNENNQSIEEMVSEAEKANALAKKQGKNRIIIA